ncbi:ketol-acid reductoisomerase [Coraliomargarita sp. W4R53]
MRHSVLALQIALLSIFVGCSTLPKKAIITKTHVARAIEMETTFASNSATFAPPGEAWFEVKHGSSNVLIVAPHATRPTREGKLRFPDGGTGSLAVMLAELTDSTVIYTTYASPSDPNYYDDNEFKRELARLIETEQPRLVLDIHASHWYRPYDVDFGTMNGESIRGNRWIIKSLMSYLKDEGISNFSMDYFAATAHETVTKFVSQQGIPCIQLEINANYTGHQHDSETVRPQMFAQVLQGLVRFVEDVKRTKK